MDTARLLTKVRWPLAVLVLAGMEYGALQYAKGKPSERYVTVSADRGNIVACSLAIAAVHAEVYKWVDDQGKVRYSDAPPRGTVSKKVELPVSTPQQRENARERLKAFLDQRKAQETLHNQEQVDKREAQAAKRREKGKRVGRCLAAQEQFDLLQLGRPVFDMDEKGQRVYLEDKDRPVLIARLKDEIATCRKSKAGEREFKLAREEQFWFAACRYFDSVLQDAEDPQFDALSGSEIMSLKEVRKSYCVGARPGPGPRGQSEAVKRNACEELQYLARYLMSAPEVSGGAVSFSAMVDEQCRH
ncbi:MAG: DUF4124 domain-containing protein [Gammaproteobacteria bacterium]